MSAVSGMVYDSGGAPASGRILRVYRRDTGALLGSAVSSDGNAIDGDDEYANVEFLLNLNGTDGATTFTDGGPNGYTVTRSADAQIDTAQFKYGGASALFDGSGDDLRVPMAGWNPNTETHWTLEGWIRTTGTTWCFASSGNSGNGDFYVECLGDTFYLGDATANPISFGSTSSFIPNNTWRHLAIVRNNTTLKVYIEGTERGSTTTMLKNLALNEMILGRRPVGSGAALNGHLDSVRLTRGVARYTAAFTPPADEFPENPDIPATPVGSYEISTGAYTGEVQVVCLDADGGTLENDLILRTTPV